MKVKEGKYDTGLYISEIPPGRVVRHCGSRMVGIVATEISGKKVFVAAVHGAAQQLDYKAEKFVEYPNAELVLDR